MIIPRRAVAAALPLTVTFFASAQQYTISAGKAFVGAAPTTNPVRVQLSGASVTPLFAGLSGAGLYQINLTVPAGLGTGDVSVAALVGGVQTQSGVVISLQ